MITQKIDIWIAWFDHVPRIMSTAQWVLLGDKILMHGDSNQCLKILATDLLQSGSVSYESMFLQGIQLVLVSVSATWTYVVETQAVFKLYTGLRIGIARDLFLFSNIYSGHDLKVSKNNQHYWFINIWNMFTVDPYIHFM